MKILAIETSCDETAVSIVEASGGLEKPRFKTRAHVVNSQIELHKQYGGVFPIMAKRAHAENIVSVLKTALKNAQVEPGCVQVPPGLGEEMKNKLKEILAREETVYQPLITLYEEIGIPDIDAITVTVGPGLEPALWVGINTARALSLIWDKPLIPANHMEGHIVSVLATAEERSIHFPLLALLISGGHTELVQADNWHAYKILGETRDDAVGECFDKIARTLGLPYPGGPEISRRAEEAREKNIVSRFILPRPMIHSKDYDFSFSGLKTSVLYTIQKLEKITPEIVSEMALATEDAITDTLISKTKKALVETDVRTLILGGGVVANKHIRNAFEKMIADDFPTIQLLFPEQDLTTDNATMIAMAGYLNYLRHPEMEKERAPKLVAQGNLRL